MPDSILDLDSPTPNIALERLRQAILSTDDLYMLTDALFELASSALATVEALSVRVEALETAAVSPVTEPAP